DDLGNYELDVEVDIDAGNAPSGYKLTVGDDPTKITLSDNVCLTIPFGYVKTGQFVIEKVDSNDESIKLPGATFEVKNSKGKVVDTLTTESDGTVTSSDLPEGTYTLVETTAPSGYALTPGQDLKVTIDGDASDPVRITITNDL